MDTLLNEELFESSSVKGYQVYKRRWLMLALFSMVTMSQTLFWLTFSPISGFARGYFHLCDGFDTNATADADSCARVNGKGQGYIDLMLMWGGITYVLSLPAFLVLTSNQGLRSLMLFMSATLCAACSLRIIPLKLLDEYDIYVVNVAQILIALTGPIAMSTPPKLSATWFPPTERTLSTALACSGGLLGIALGFPMSTYIVSEVSDVNHLLWIHFLISATSLLLILAFFSDMPPLPPSATAPSTFGKSAPDLLRRERAGSTIKSRKSDVWTALTDVNFALLSFGGGMCIGVFNGWSASLDSILVFFTTRECAWLGMATTLSFVIGNLMTGQTSSEKAWLRRIQKQILVFFVFAVLLFFAAMTVSMNFLSHAPLLPRTFDSVCLSVVFAGFFLGCANPFLYEISVEMTYPISETVSAGILTFWIQSGTLSVLVVKRFVAQDAMNAVMTSAALLGLVCLFCSKARYGRLEEEDRERERSKLSTSNGVYIGDGSGSYGSFGPAGRM
jgi:hypothetical protein|eukprot:Stramenopile-MAST_4_protein_2150